MSATTRNILIAAALIILIGAFFVWKKHRDKKRANTRRDDAALLKLYIQVQGLAKLTIPADKVKQNLASLSDEEAAQFEAMLNAFKNVPATAGAAQSNAITNALIDFATQLKSEYGIDDKGVSKLMQAINTKLAVDN